MAQTDSCYRILALDDHPMVLEGLTHLLSNQQTGTTCVGITSTSQLIAELGGDRRADLFILDLELPGNDGFEAIKLIRKEWNKASILVYTMHEEPWLMACLARLDIQGLVSKSHPVSELVQAVAIIRGGGTYFSETYLEQLRLLQERQARHAADGTDLVLSDREHEVLDCIQNGMTTSEISKKLCISENTVGTYRRRLMSKFGTHNVAQLIAAARKYLE